MAAVAVFVFAPTFLKLRPDVVRKPSQVCNSLMRSDEASSHEHLRISKGAAQCQTLDVHSPHTQLLLAALVGSTAPIFLGAQEAYATDGEFGILEGRTFALLHPVVMGGLFVYTIWAGYLGWQWRQVRTIQGDINELKKQIPKKDEADPPSEVEIKIQQLTEIRKELVKGGFRDKHFNAGSILLAFGVSEAVGGCLNTWFRTGKLFPGPHLFAGGGITVLWALAAALVPAMQKGSESARNLHIALNTLNVLLFIWQIPTGLEIVLKVLEFTKFP